MSYEDIEDVRATRAAKYATKGPGKRGRKRKSGALETDEPEAEAGPEMAQTMDAPKQWRAAVARMY